MIRALRFTAVSARALIFGLRFAPIAELPGKLRLDGPQWLTVQQNLYVGFGVFAAAVEPVAIALSWLLTYRFRRRRPAFGLTVTAALCASAGLVGWALVVAPMNALLNGWTPTTLPIGWRACRDRWELGHALHGALFAVAWCALLGSLVAETASESR